MLDLSWSHIVILLIVALVVVGPKDLPRLMRIIGQWTGKARAMANEFRRSLDDMARELEKSIIPDDMKSDAALMKAKEAPSVSLEPEPVAAAETAVPVEI